MRRDPYGDEQTIEPVVRHAQAGAIVEIGLIEPESAVGLEINDVVKNQLCEFRFAVGSKAHHLVFSGIHLEPGIVGERRIQQAE